MRGNWIVPAILFDFVARAAMAATPVLGSPPAGFGFDGAVGEWAAQEAAFSLVPEQPGARDGRIWLGLSEDGLIVAGAVDGAPPRFAASSAQMPSGDHVEVWLAFHDKPMMPPVGWGHQFGPQELQSAADCAKHDYFGEDAEAVAACKKWYAAQLRYRNGIARLFARQWQLAPNVAVETWAKPVFDQMSKDERDAAAPLAPTSSAQAAFAVGSGPGYTFEIRVPWDAMPPANDLSLGRLRLMVDVFSPGTGGKYGAFSTTSETRKYGRLDTLNDVTVDPPKRFRLTQCGYPLEMDDFWYEKKLPAYFFPAATEIINRIFALENPVVGYQYEPGGASPEVKLKTFFGRDLAPDVLVCGPDLAIKRGDTVAFSGKVLRLDFKSVKVPDGWLLANGPVTGLSSRLGTGTCGACPLIHLDVMFLPEAHGSPSVVYAEQWQVEDEDVSSPSRNARVLLAEDLRSIQTWTAEPDDAFEKASWTFTQFCYEPGRHTYVECKKEGNVKPPAHVAMPHE